MIQQFNIYPLGRRKLWGVILPLALVALGGCRNDEETQRIKTGERQGVQPQLYLATISDSSVKKGFIEKEDKPIPDGKVAFRECSTATAIRIGMEKLHAVEGNCEGGPNQWVSNDFFVGSVKTVAPNGSVGVATTAGRTIELSADAWQKGFKVQKGFEANKILGVVPPPRVGQFVGGLKPEGGPQNMFVIEERI